MKKRLVVAGLAAVMTLSAMPLTAFAAETEEPVQTEQTEVENTTPAEQPATETQNENVEQPVVEQPIVEQPAAEQIVAEQPVAEQPVAEQPAAEQLAVEQPAAEQEAAETSEAPAPVEEAPAPVRTVTTPITVRYHFYTLNANGEYVETRSASKTVKTGNSTSAVSQTTANGYVTTKNVTVENGRYSYNNTWQFADGRQAAFPLSMTYDEAAAIAGNDDAIDVAVYAQYDYRQNVRLTLRFTDIRHANGTVTECETSNNLSPGSGWNFTKKKFESTTGLRTGDTFSYGGYTYTYTGLWADANGNVIDASVSLSFKNSAGNSAGNTYYLSEDTVLELHPIYEARMNQGLEVYYVDQISTGSGSWTNRGAAEGYSRFNSFSHRFTDPSVATPIDHYEFLRWENRDDSSETFGAGDTYTYVIDENLPQGTVTTVTIDAVWQPSVTVRYLVPGSLAGNADETYIQTNETEDFEGVRAYDYQPEYEGAEFQGWHDADGNEVEEDAVFTAPAETRAPIERQIENLYAAYSTQYTVEHYLENQDGTYSMEESEEFSDLIGTEVAAEANEYTGYTFDEEAEDTIASADLAVGTVLRLYYSRNVIEEPEAEEPEAPVIEEPEAEEPEAPVIEEPEAEEPEAPVIEAPEAEEPEAPAIEEPETEATENEQTIIPEAEIPAVIPAAAPAAASAAAPAPAAENEDIEDERVPMAAPAAAPVEVINEEATPLANRGTAQVLGSWALINLLCTIGSVAAAAGMAVTYFRKKEEENQYSAEGGNEDEDRNNRRKVKFLGLIPGIGSIAALLLTEDFTQKMVMIDKWTVLMVVILAAAVILAIATKNRRDEEEQAEAQA